MLVKLKFDFQQKPSSKVFFVDWKAFCGFCSTLLGDCTQSDKGDTKKTRASEIQHVITGELGEWEDVFLKTISF